MTTQSEENLLEWAAALQGGCIKCKHFVHPLTGRKKYVTEPNMLRHMIAKHNYRIYDDTIMTRVKRQPWWRRLLHFMSS